MARSIVFLINQVKRNIPGRIMSFLDQGTNNNFKFFLIKAVAGTFGVKVINTVLIYVVNLILARCLGVADFGAYTYTTTWVQLLVIPAVLGLEGLVAREVAVYVAKSEWSLTYGLLKWSNRLVSITSISLAILASLIAWFTISSSAPQALLGFGIAMLSLPFVALSRLQQATMQALNYIVAGQLPDMLVRPLLFVGLLGAYIFWSTDLTVVLAIVISVVVNGTAWIASTVQLHRALPSQVRRAEPEYCPKVWLQSALPMLFIGGMYLINNQTDALMLGAMKGTEAVGLYTVASKGASLVTFILIAFNTSLAPTFASLYAMGNRRELQRIVTKSCQLILLLVVPIVISLIAFGHWFLLLFGSDFVAGQPVLTILSLGYLANASTGSVALLLLMTGHEKDTAIGVTTSALLNVALNAVLIPSLSIEGAAIATSISMVVWNVLLAFSAYKRLGINSTVFGKID